jgi:hypothetical protein
MTWGRACEHGGVDVFVVARNPDGDSRLPFLLYLPLEGGLVLKAKEDWPRSSRVYCHPVEGGWPGDAEVIESVEVRVCRRRGSAVDLVLDRGRNSRSQFVFTTLKGRSAIFWQTPKALRGARPGVRVPTGRPLRGAGPLEVTIDTRERYPYRFATHTVDTRRLALPCGDYGVYAGELLVAAVERKTGEDLVASLHDGSLGFAMAELAGLVAAAVVVEDRYSSLFKLAHAPRGFTLDLLARLEVRYPGVSIVFAESRKTAEEWTYRFLAAARSEFGGEA